MPIEVRHDTDPGLLGAIAFLTSKGKRREADNREAERLAQQQAQQNLALMNSLFPQGQGPGSAFAPRPQPQQQPPGSSPLEQALAFLQQQSAGAVSPQDQMQFDLQQSQLANDRYKIDRQAGAERAKAGMGFLSNQTNILADFASQQNATNNAAAMAERQAANNAAMMDRQAANAGAIDQRQQVMAELQANLRQRDENLQSAPGMVDVEALVGTQGQIDAGQQALIAPERFARQKIAEGIAAGDPAAIKEGLQRGMLEFSPEQKTRIKQLKQAMSELDTDQRLSPSQRAIAQRQLSEELNAIRPMEVEQPPLSLLEQYQQNTITTPHPTAGIPVTRQRVMRNGEEKWELTDESAADLDAYWQRKNEQDKLKFEKDNQLGDYNPQVIENKRRETEMAHRTKMFDSKMKALDQITKLEASLATLAISKEQAEGTPDPADNDRVQAAIDFAYQQIERMKAEIAFIDQQDPSAGGQPADPYAVPAPGQPVPGLPQIPMGPPQVPQAGPPPAPPVPPQQSPAPQQSAIPPNAPSVTNPSAQVVDYTPAAGGKPIANPQELMSSPAWLQAPPGSVVRFVDVFGRTIEVPKQ